ncbi:MAG: NAD(P)/FAD-dependent oxidoreductase [Chitinophagaceae bacterium]|nr:MAG: NAD(P)/FAD-dependent oxidoreductase [Chitinophagaceae bacterium]
MTNKFDAIVIGSGVGGLITANLLAREGLKVCVLEKNKQIGGALQVYVRQRVIFDTGVHYIGGLAPGENLHQLFKFLGIMDKLKLKRVEGVFDKVIISGDAKEYRMAQGYQHFIDTLLEDFPGESVALHAYCDKIKDICSRFGLYNLRAGGTFEEKAETMELDTRAFLESITENKKLQAVLAGNNMLYAGQPDKTPFYVHALILNSYIESTWKCVNGGSQIAKLLSRSLHAQGGVVRIHSEVKNLVETDGKICYAELKDGSKLEADIFVSNIHPAKTLEMTASSQIRNSFRNRIKQLENSVSSFTVDIILKPGCFPVFDCNYYYHKEGHIWDGPDYKAEAWPLVYGAFMPPQEDNQFARSLSLLTYMRFEEMAPWAGTFNTVSQEEPRGADYEAFKKDKAERLIDVVEEKFPGLRNCIESYYTSTPLSYRDYIGNDDGSMYGIVRDFRDPMRTMISPRTKVPNLYLTGQNMNMHGILGAALSALATSIAITGREDLIDRIRHA